MPLIDDEGMGVGGGAVGRVPFCEMRIFCRKVIMPMGQDLWIVRGRSGDGGSAATPSPASCRRRALTPEGGRLIYRVGGWGPGPIPLPRVLKPSTRAHEEVDAEGRLVFDVGISLPLIGRLALSRLAGAGWMTTI